MRNLKNQFNPFILFLLLFCLSVSFAYGQDVFSRGEQAFMHNKPEEASALLEIALQNDPSNMQIYVYLGIAYRQLGYVDRAIQMFGRGLENTTHKAHQLYYNLALAYVQKGATDKAFDAYTQAIATNQDFGAAYLNRGNLYVRSGQYTEAIQDYRVYLDLEPDGRQSEEVARMISALETEIAEALMQAQRERIAREEEQRQAEERRKRLLGSVLESLEDISRESDPLGAEAEDFDDFDFEIGREN